MKSELNWWILMIAIVVIAILGIIALSADEAPPELPPEVTLVLPTEVPPVPTTLPTTLPPPREKVPRVDEYCRGWIEGYKASAIRFIGPPPDGWEERSFAECVDAESETLKT